MTEIFTMTFRLLDLPAEIREQIYREVLCTENARRDPPPRTDDPGFYEYDLNLLRVNHLVYQEAKKIFQDNVFVKILTPWSSSIEHISNEGKVPLVTRGPSANAFEAYHLQIYIDTPDHSRDVHGLVGMVTTLEDLPAFTQMWRYANLNHQQNLNPPLRLTLQLQDPHVPNRKISKAMQEKLLLPFEHVKDLAVFVVEGQKILPSVKTRLHELRALPEPTPADCINHAFALKDEGNKALNEGKYKQALGLYKQSFEAIHITVRGHIRTVHADGFFCTEILGGPHPGRADFLRMTLRIRLVANIVLTYLKLQDYAEAHFWGKRTIVLFRHSMRGYEMNDTNFYSGSQMSTISSAMDDDNSNIDILTGGLMSDDRSRNMSSLEQRFLDDLAITQFPGQAEMGKIFYRTALAAKEMGKMADVRTLMRAAEVYLPHEESVKEERRKLDMEDLERKRTEGEAIF